WDATTGVSRGPALPIPGLAVFVAGTRADGFSPDGKACLFVGEDSTIWICDVTTGSIRGRTPPVGDIAYGAGLSPDGKTFFTALGTGEVQLWDAATLTRLGDPIFQAGAACCVGGFSPDGKSLLIPCEDGRVWVLDLATRKPLIPPLRHESRVWSLAVSPDGKTI